MDEWSRPADETAAAQTVIPFEGVTSPVAVPGEPTDATGATEPSQSAQGRRSRGPVVALTGLVVGAVVLAGGAVTYGLSRAADGAWPGGNAAGSSRGLGGHAAAVPASLGSADAVTAAVAPATVNIVSTLGYSGGQAAGTGIVLTSDGIVLTNNHVVRGSTALSVTDVGNGQTYDATVLGYDRSHDVALIKLQDASGLQTASLGSSAAVAVGDDVVGIGNAGGKGGFPTSAAGTVAGLGRSITAHDESDGSSEQLTGLIQVDADIQAGESGGPLANAKGQVIGMDTAGSAGYDLQSGGPDGSGGQGFAVPIDTALSIARQIHDGHGSDTVHLGASAFLGVQIASAAGSQDGSQSGGQSGDQGASQGAGVGVSGVLAGSTAETAGLVAGDTLVGVGDDAVRTPDALATEMDTLHPGDHVVLHWVDADGSSRDAEVTLASGPTG